MSESVQVLWFEQENQDGEDTELLIGVYRTEEDVAAAIDRLRDQPGFREFPQGFKAYAYPLNQDHWTRGFVRVQ